MLNERERRVERRERVCVDGLVYALRFCLHLASFSFCCYLRYITLYLIPGSRSRKRFRCESECFAMLFLSLPLPLPIHIIYSYVYLYQHLAYVGGAADAPAKSIFVNTLTYIELYFRKVAR